MHKFVLASNDSYIYIPNPIYEIQIKVGFHPSKGQQQAPILSATVSHSINCNVSLLTWLILIFKNLGGTYWQIRIMSGLNLKNRKLTHAIILHDMFRKGKQISKGIVQLMIENFPR